MAPPRFSMCVNDWCCSRLLLFIRPRKAIWYSMNIAWDWISVVSSFTMERFWGVTKFPPSFLHSLVLTSTLCLPVVQAYFGRAKAACLCWYFCNHHLCYDGGRLGRVKIVTLRVGARAKKGPPPLFRVSTCSFASKTFAHPKKTPALQANIVQFDTTSTQSHSKPQNALRLFWGVGHN